MQKPIRVRVLLLLWCLVLPTAAWAAPLSDIFVFGDSLSDSGNVLLATGGLIPGPPTAYFNGRFSNGPTYADVLATRLNLGPLAPSLAGGTNYAYGGASTDAHPLEAIFGPGFGTVQTQVSQFLTDVSHTADPSALYVVFAGANNLRDALLGNPLDAPAAITNAIGDLHGILTDLIAAGAQTILVPNVPNLGLTPQVAGFGPGAVAFATALTLNFNAALEPMLNSFTGVTIIPLNTFGFFQELVAHPGNFGLSDVTSRCYTGDDQTFTGGGTICSTPDTFLFWDGVHPTAAVHALIADRALAALPEPGSFVLFASGLAGLALWYRSKARKNS